MRFGECSTAPSSSRLEAVWEQCAWAPNERLWALSMRAAVGTGLLSGYLKMRPGMARQRAPECCPDHWGLPWHAGPRPLLHAGSVACCWHHCHQLAGDGMTACWWIIGSMLEHCRPCLYHGHGTAAAAARLPSQRGRCSVCSMYREGLCSHWISEGCSYVALADRCREAGMHGWQ